uniref:MPN domain-containing protein n=1 Tax=Glossina austeni TaxID=7395 RepID=A0A1A9UD19_GLOAU
MNTLATAVKNNTTATATVKTLLNANNKKNSTIISDTISVTNTNTTNSVTNSNNAKPTSNTTVNTNSSNINNSNQSLFKKSNKTTTTTSLPTQTVKEQQLQQHQQQQKPYLYTLANPTTGNANAANVTVSVGSGASATQTIIKTSSKFVHDNPALTDIFEQARAHPSSYNVRPIYILDSGVTEWTKIGANRWRFLQESLEDLHGQLEALGRRLYVIRGSPSTVFPRLFKEWRVEVLTFEEDIEPYALNHGAVVKEMAKATNATMKTHYSHTIYDPHSVIRSNEDKAPLTYQKFMEIVKTLEQSKPLEKPKSLGNRARKTEEVVDNAINYVQCDGLAVMKIVKHSHEESSIMDLAQGALLGLVVDKCLEITNCFPFPKSDDETMDEEMYQLTMMRRLRRVNVDHFHVAWYQSANVGNFLSMKLLESQFHYQSSIEVVVVYDTQKSSPGFLCLKAYCLTQQAIQMYKDNDLHSLGVLLRSSIIHLLEMLRLMGWLWTREVQCSRVAMSRTVEKLLVCACMHYRDSKKAEIEEIAVK